MTDVLALHGFTQRGAMWDEVAALAGGEWDAPDLPGHGGTPPMGWDEAVAWVSARAAAEGAATLIGYSMGGRLALAAALEEPGPIRRLVLVSAGMGVEDPAARERRRREDGQTAERIERLGLDLFLTEWLARPMFSGLGRRPAHWGGRDLRMRLTNDPAGLAAVVRSLGQGAQPHLGSRLGGLAMPVVAVAGERDEAYAAIARRIAAAAPDGCYVGVPGAGHSVVGEDPAAVASTLEG